MLVFFTDGVTEAWNEQGEEYEEYRLIKAVHANRNRSAAQILARIQQDANKHVGRAQQSDDFTCVVVKILPNQA